MNVTSILTCYDDKYIEVQLTTLLYASPDQQLHQVNSDSSCWQLTFFPFSEPSVSRTPLLCMWRYRSRCSDDMSHFITYSTCTITTITQYITIRQYIWWQLTMQRTIG